MLGDMDNPFALPAGGHPVTTSGDGLRRHCLLDSRVRGNDDGQPSILEKSATVSVVARMRFSRRKRLARRSGSVALTVTWLKNSSTGVRSLAISAMAAAKFSRATAVAAAFSTSST